MAKLKDRAQIKRRDPDFSSVLEIKENASVAPVTPKAKQEAIPGPKVEKVSLANATPTPATAADQSSKDRNPGVEIKDLEEPAAKPGRDSVQKPSVERSASNDGPKDERQTGTKQKGRGEKARLRFGFRFPDDLIQRAEVWAEKARCPVSAILRKSFGELRPVLIERLEKGIRYTEIPHDRVTDASVSFDTSIMIDKGSYERLVKEIDPEGIMGIEAPMSRWARAQFIEHFGKYLEKHGY